MTTLTGAELVANIPKEAGDCVGLLDYKGRLFVACQFVMFEFFPSPTHAAKGRLLPIEIDNLTDPPGLIILRNAMRLIATPGTMGVVDIAREAMAEAGYPLEEPS